MLQKFLFIILFEFMKSLDIPTIEFGSKIQFNLTYNQFQFVNNELQEDFALIYILPGSNCRSLMYHQEEVSTGNFVSSILEYNGKTLLFSLFSKGSTHSIKIERKEEKSCYNMKGELWINPLLNELNMDLNTNYAIETPLIDTNYLDKKMSPLTYIIKKAIKTVKYEFKYNDNFEKFGEKIYVPNPFKVCHKDNCKEDIESYKFIKGESYKIYIKIQKVESYQVLPSFSLINKDLNNGQLFKVKFLIIVLAFLLI